MSEAIFPSMLGGYAWDSKKKPVFHTLTHSPLTGRDVRVALYSQPVFEFSLVNNWLSKADKESLIGFFLARSGNFDSFLYADEDSVMTAHAFAMGNGVNTAFQLYAGFGSHTNLIVNNVAGNPSIYIDSVLKTAGTHYSISTTGVVTFVTPPASNALISWTGTAYYRCVFLEESLEYNQFARLLYDCSEITFKGAMVNKL